MSFNFDGVGEAIAAIRNKNDKKKNIIVYINSDSKKKTKSDFKRLYLEDDDDFFQQLPNIKYRCGYTCGISGSGKSHYILNYAKEYSKLFKNNNIFLFSALDKDETLDSFKKIHRVPLTHKLIDNPLKLTDFEDALNLFDDIDNIHDDDMRDTLKKNIRTITNTGRHTDAMIFMSYHLPSGGIETKAILNECGFFVYYPKFAKKKITYVLEEYIGMDKKFHDKMKKKDSRWCCVFCIGTPFVLLENEIFIYEV